MPQDYDLNIDGKSFNLTWGKATPPTQADIEGIVTQYRAQAKQPAPSATPAPTQNFTGSLAAGKNTPSNFREDLSAPAPITDDPQTSVYEPPTNPGAMGAAPIYRNPATGQRVSPLGDNPGPVQQYRNDYFNEIDPHKYSIPMQAAVALSKNPNDPVWLARVAKMSPIGQQEIPKKAQELAAAPVYDSTPSGTLGTFGQAPIYRDPQSGERVDIPKPHDIIGTMLHGPEGYKQLQTATGAIPEITRLAEGALDPENLAFIAAAGAIGGMGKIGSAVVKGGIGALMGANAISKVRQGDYGGAAVDATLGLLPLAEHPISEAVAKVKNKRAMIGTANALDAQDAATRASIAAGEQYTPSVPIAQRAAAPVVPTVEPTLPVAATPPAPSGIQRADVSALAKDGFTKAADLYAKAKQANPTLTKQEFAQQLYDFHKEHAQDGGAFNYEGNTGNLPREFVATTADGRRIPYSGFSEKTPPKAVAPPVVEPSVPSEPAVSSAPSEPPTPSEGIRAANEETAARRAEKGLPDLPGYTAKTSEEVYQEARDQGQAANALSVADDVIANKRAMTAHEIAANVLKQNEIEAQQDALYKQITEAAKAGRPFDALQADYDALDQHYQKLTDATKYSGAEQSLAFRIRDYEVNRYSRNQILKRLELAKPDAQVTEADKNLAAQSAERHTTAQTELDKAQSALDTHLSAADEKASQKAAEAAIESMKPKGTRSVRQAVRADQRATLEAEHADIVNRLVKATAQSNFLVDPAIVPIIRDLARNRVKAGLLTVADVVDAVHAAVEPHLPGITKREVRDAISGHGYGSKIPIGTQFGDLKKQMRLLSDIENIRDKVPAPPRARRPISPEEAALRKQKAEALAEGKPSRPAKRSAADVRLNGYKKQLSNTIDDLTRRIAEKDFTAKGRSKLLLDPEAEALKAQRDGLQKVYDSLDPAKQKAPAEPKASKATERAAQSRLDRLTKQFNDMKAANSKGEYGKPDAPARPDTPEEVAMRHQLDAARAERDAMRSAQKECVPADPLKAYKNRLTTQIADMQTHIDSGLADRATGGKTRQLDAEAKILRDQRDQMRENVNRERAKIDRIIEARKGKSFLDKYAIYHRAAILSRVSTLGKLASAAAQRAIFTPLEDAAGGLMRAIPGYGKIADMAPHGTASLDSYVAFGKSAGSLKENSVEAKVKLKTGMNYMDARYGTHGPEADTDSLNLFTAPQNSHGAIKTYIQRPLFEKSMVQQERYELRQGHDINDPAVRTVMEARAYQKSKEGILMQDNMLSTAWHGMVKGLEANPRLGKSGKVMAAAARAAMPIVKVPSNFVGEAISHTPSVGLIRPAYEIAISKGIENLSPEQADIIVTALKKHAVGTALFALGYYGADRMGGFYHKGGNGMNDVKPNEVRITMFGVHLPDVPSTFLHSPQMEVMMMGAAFRQAIEHAQNSRSRDPQSPAGEALHRTATGVAEALPFVDTPKRLLQATEGSVQAGKAAGETLGSLTVPGFLPDVANQLDRDAQNHMQVRKRPAKGFGDAIKLSTGVLRGTVPEDSGRRR